MTSIRVLAALAFLGCAGSRPAVPTPGPAPIRKVHPTFRTSLWGDYLFYLFYRGDDLVRGAAAISEEELAPLERPAPFVAEAVASEPSILDYASFRAAVLRIAPDRPDIWRLVDAGEAHFQAFADFWRSDIQPREEETIATWQKQWASCHPFERLQQMTGLPFPFEQLDIVALALHPSGSGRQDPPVGLYSSLFKKPNLAWFVGHEGGHLLFARRGGADWKAHPLAPRALLLVRERGGDEYDLEESLSLFLQVSVSKECGLTPRERVFSEGLRDIPLRQKIVAEMERRWAQDAGLRTGTTIIDFMLESAIAALEAASANVGSGR